MHRSFVYSLLLVGTSAPCPRVAIAQQRDSTGLPRIVVTATRSERPHGAGVATATVLNGDSLRAQGVADVAEALRLVPAMHLVRSGGPGAPVSLFARGGESDYVRVLVDGVPVNEPGGAVDLSMWTLDGIERIEVVRGPASVLYGSDAMTGVVQLFTRASARSRQAALRASSASFATRHYEASLETGGARAQVTAGGARRRSNGIHPFNSQWWNESLRARVATSLGGGRLTLSGMQHRDQQQYPTDGTGRVVDRNAYRAGRRSVMTLDAMRSVGPRVRMTTTLSALEGRGSTVDGADGPADTLGVYAYRARGAVRRRVADGRLEWEVSPHLLSTLGAEWSLEAQHSRDSSNFGGSPAFAAERTTRAVFAQLAGGSTRWQMTAGVRHDANSVFGGFSTARGGVAWLGGRGVRVRANVGTGFKAPGFLEQFNTAFTTGNPDLDPERTRSVEFGASQEVHTAAWSITAFRQRFANLIQYTYRENAPNYFNVARASADGVEATGELQVAPWLGVRAGATMLRTRVDDAGLDEGVTGALFVRGQRLLRRPTHTATLGATARPGSRAAITATLTRIGDRDDRNFGEFPAIPVVLPAFTRLDLAAQVRLHAGAEVLVRMDNLQGKRYQEVFGFRAPGRQLLVGLDLAVKQ